LAIQTEICTPKGLIEIFKSLGFIFSKNFRDLTRILNPKKKKKKKMDEKRGTTNAGSTVAGGSVFILCQIQKNMPQKPPTAKHPK
jgi:hypothetical protein